MEIQEAHYLIVLDSDYNSDVKTILLKYAREPSMASTFNHASMAHNNHFYFKCLTNDKSRQKMDPVLKKNLERSFNSIETLRAEMLATANAMFGPGFVWLVQNQTNKANFHILTTYIAGSPYPGAHWRAQPHDLNTGLHIPGHERQDAINSMGSPNNNVGAHGSHSEAGKDERKYAPGGVNIKPLLCVNTWEHAYMRDWGLDKRGFLQAWWKRIDWTTVAGEADLSSGNTSKFQMGA